MAENGMNGTMKLLSWTVGIIAFLITLYTVFHVPLVNAIAVEAQTRQCEDTRIQKELSDCISKNKETLAEIKVMMAEVRSDIKYIKRNGQ